MKKPLISILVSACCVLLLLGAGAVWWGLGNVIATRLKPARMIDMSALLPGTEKSIQIGGHKVQISVPSGEGFSFGTIRIETPDVGYSSPRIERNGGVEAVWIADVNGDGAEDGVFVVRCAGSGSYVSLFVMESNGASFRAHNVPSINGVSGYMGHDEFRVVENSLVRRFPIYKDGDSNAKPSAGTRKLTYGLIAGEASWILKLNDIH